MVPVTPPRYWSKKQQQQNNRDACLLAGAAPARPVALWTLVDNRASSQSAVLCSKLGAAGQTAGGQGVDRDAEGQDGEDLRELHVGRI